MESLQNTQERSRYIKPRSERSGDSPIQSDNGISGDTTGETGQKKIFREERFQKKTKTKIPKRKSRTENVTHQRLANIDITHIREKLGLSRVVMDACGRRELSVPQVRRY